MDRHENTVAVAPRGLRSLRETVADLPTIPETLTRILRLLDDPRSCASNLGDVIRCDPPLASKVLRLANSPYYNKSREIATIQECVAVLGFRTVRQAALCVAVVSSLGQEFDRRKPRLDFRDLWKHCVATGAIAKALARIRGHADPELVFSAGLLHDLGKFVLALHAPAAYQTVIADRCRTGESLVVAERAAFGFDHCDAGAEMGQAWLFPLELVGACAHHHGGQDARGVDGLVQLADYLANLLAPTRGDLGFDPSHVSPAALYRAAELERETIEARIQELRDVVAEARVYTQVA